MKLKINKNVFFDDITHSYLNSDNKYLIGVTGLMRKHGLAPDYSNVDAGTLNRKAAYGSAVHKSIERYIKGESVESTPELEAYISMGIRALASEYLISDNETVASSVDIVTEELDLIDVKTTYQLHLNALQWQLSIYAYLFEMQNPKLHGVVTQYEAGYKNIRVYPYRDYTDELGAAHGNFTLTRAQIEEVLRSSIGEEFLTLE